MHRRMSCGVTACLSVFASFLRLTMRRLDNMGSPRGAEFSDQRSAGRSATWMRLNGRLGAGRGSYSGRGCGSSRVPYRAIRSGQALVIGITVMFVMLTIGMLFLRNAIEHLQSSSTNSQQAIDQAIAQSGIDFADNELVNSSLGADWRPQPRNLNPGGLLAGYAADPTFAALDPDFQYLRPWAPADAAPVQVLVYKGQPVFRSLSGPTGGYTRLSFGRGRSLIRVTYNPRNALSFSSQNVNLPLSTDIPAGATTHVRGPWVEYGPTPLSRYMRIDTIGRLGDTSAIDSAVGYTDPTLLENAGVNQSYRVQMVAYKPFGLGDHLLFVTNKDKLGGQMDIGGSPAGTKFNETPGQVPGDVGAPELAGPMQVNGDSNFTSVDALMDEVLPYAGVDVAGQVLGTPYVGPAANAVTLSSTTQSALTGSLVPGDWVLDNQWFSNPQASIYRSIRRLQSAPIDLARYRTLANSPGNEGFYVPNYTDMQPQLTLPGTFLSSVHSSQDLTMLAQSWANPYKPPASDSTSWDSGNPGYNYAPPAVDMAFNHPGPLTATDPDPLHQQYYFIRVYWPGHHWDWPNEGAVGSGPSSQSEYIDLYYTPDALTDPAVLNAAAATSKNARRMTDPVSGVSYDAPVALVADHTIFAEGNISVHGCLAPAMTSTWWNYLNGSNVYSERNGAQLSVVTRGTIYVDGGLVRAEDEPAGSGPLPVQDIKNYGLTSLLVPSSMAFVAQDHVAANLTRTVGATRVQPWDPSSAANNQPDTDVPATEPDVPPGSANGNLRPAVHWTFDPNASSSNSNVFRLTFSLAGINQTPGHHFRLYLRHASQSVNSETQPNTEVDAFLNPPPGNAPGNTATGKYVDDTTPYAYTIGGNNVTESWGFRTTGAFSEILKAGATTLPQEQQSITPLVIADGSSNGWEYASYILPDGQLNLNGDNVIDVQVTGAPYYLSRVVIKSDDPNVSLPPISLDATFVANEGGFYVIPQDYFYLPATSALSQRQPDGPIPINPTGMPFDYSTLSGNAAPVSWATDTSYPAVGAGSAGATLLHQLSLSGSLTVNTMAPLSDQARWVQLAFTPVGGTTLPGPWYQYDDALVDIAYREGFWLPVMPRLAMAPGMVYQGSSQS